MLARMLHTRPAGGVSRLFHVKLEALPGGCLVVNSTGNFAAK